MLRKLVSLRFMTLRPRKTLNIGDRAELAEFFDAPFYLEGNPEAARSGADPPAHRFAAGWRKGTGSDAAILRELQFGGEPRCRGERRQSVPALSQMRPGGEALAQKGSCLRSRIHRP